MAMKTRRQGPETDGKNILRDHRQDGNVAVLIGEIGNLARRDTSVVNEIVTKTKQIAARIFSFP